MALISRGLTASFAKAKVPCSRISRAARRKAPRAARQRALPTLTRVTPIAERPARLVHWAIHGADNSGNVFLTCKTRSIESIGARLLIGLQMRATSETTPNYPLTFVQIYGHIV